MKFNNRNQSISDSAVIAPDVRIGDNVTIYDNVTIQSGTTICNDVVLGEPMADYYNSETYENPPTMIGKNSLIRSHSIIYSGCRIGHHFSTGHRVNIRENTSIGNHCMIGTLCDIQHEVQIGNYCRLNSHVTLSQDCRLGDFVFMYPFSVLTNDPAPPSEKIKGSSVGDYSQICVHAVVLPGLSIGAHCLVGANSVVSKSIPDFSLAAGSPAKIVSDIRKYVVMGVGKAYPWMNRFSRGMPWHGIGYDQWLAQGAPLPE